MGIIKDQHHHDITQVCAHKVNIVVWWRNSMLVEHSMLNNGLFTLGATVWGVGAGYLFAEDLKRQGIGRSWFYIFGGVLMASTFFFK